MNAMRLVVLPLLLAGCASDAAINGRLDHWRAFLQREAPLGASADQAMEAMRRADLNPGRGTYVRVMNDGRRESNCRDPKAAISGREISGVRALYARYDIEVTVCLDGQGRVEKHHVAAWHQGL